MTFLNRLISRAPLAASIVTLGAASLLAGGFLIPPASAIASQATPAWSMTNVSVPTVLVSEVGRRGKYMVIVENVGGAASTGGAIVKAVLPKGLTVTYVSGEPETLGHEFPACMSENTSEAACSFTESVVPSGFLALEVGYEVTGPISSTPERASVSGGGAQS